MKEMKNRTFWIVVVCLLIVFVILMSWGCSRKESSEKVSPEDVSSTVAKPFDAKATIKMKDLVMTADVNRTAEGRATVQISEPKTLSGMSFAYDGKDVLVSYKGLTVKLDENSRLVSGAASIIVNAINAASSPSGINVSLDGKLLTVTGKSDSGQFKITMDKKSGAMATLSLPELDFECNFSDFAFR